MLAGIVWPQIWQGTWQTLYMVGVSTVASFIVGLPLGILLLLFSPGHLLQSRVIYQVCSVIVNVVRSVPFIILLIALIPFTTWVIGTSIGLNASIVPLVVGAIPFYARLTETALREVDRGVVEAAQSMGASTWQIVRRVLLPESRPGLIAGLTVTAVTLVSYTAMSGVIAGGGLGNLAVMYGYERFETNVMIITTLLMIILVQVLQMVGDRFVLHFTSRNR